MKKLKQSKAFTMMELLVVIIILGILMLIIPNLDLFYLSAAKKEGVQLVRAIIEQERVYNADNGYYFIFDNDNDKGKAIQNWKPIKALLIDNKYFKPEKEDSSDIDIDGGKINYGNDYNKIVLHISSGNCTGQYNDDCRLEVEVKASPKSRVKGWHIKGHLIEGKVVKNNKNDEVVNRIIFEEAEEQNGSIQMEQSWQEITL